MTSRKEAIVLLMLTVIATTKGIKEAQSGGVEPVRAHTEQVMGQQLKY